jgi:excisionase family DNA binding protein
VPASATELEPLLTTDQLASVLRVSTRQVRRYVAEGALPCIRLAGSVRFENADILAFIRRCRS